LICLLQNSARDYAWGSTTSIPDYFGIPATGNPMAEIWFGTHPGSMTTVQGNGTLLELRNQEPLPFLFKILAAGTPLSIQAHPNTQQAIDGFAAENALGIPLDAAHRNYKDDKHKPEMLVALTGFRAAVGFRPLAQVVTAFEQISVHASNHGFQRLSIAFSTWRQTLEDQGVQALFTQLLQSRGQLAEITNDLAKATAPELAGMGWSAPLEHLYAVPELEQLYPGDPGIIIFLLMNLVELKPFEAIQVGAGVIHAYLGGLGLEIMASSDNVLRGGLTPKHIDVAELQKVLSFDSGEFTTLAAKKLMNGLYEYPRSVSDYLMYRIEVGGQNLLADLRLANPAIVICTSGEIAIGDSKENRQVLTKGQVAYLADANFFSFSGSGTAFLGTN
jgi:mannose-6-phosphate isomerase